MRRITLAAVVILAAVSPGRCLVSIDIGALINSAANKANEIADKIWKESMLGQAVQTYGTIMRNYDESRRFYSDMRGIVENPAQFLQQSADRFTSNFNWQSGYHQYYAAGYNNPNASLYQQTVGRALRDAAGRIDAINVDDLLRRKREQDTAATKTDMDNLDREKREMQQEAANLQRMLNDLHSGNKDKVEAAKAQLAALQAQQNARLIRLLWMQAYQSARKQMDAAELAEIRRVQSQAFADAARRMIERRKREMGRQAAQDRERRTMQMLGELPDIRNPKQQIQRERR
jgi:hypothetical protein